MIFAFKNAKFIKAAVHKKDYPLLKSDDGREMPEIAVAGRSNVGKSSLLNALFHSKDLVKTSSKPGKTQTLNFFTLDECVGFVDLPGYGYAEVPMSVRKSWGSMVQNYLTQRESLQLVLCLFDIRRMPNADDFQMMQWAIHSQKAVILVLTKTDKVSRNEKEKNRRKILEAFAIENLHSVCFSTVTKTGRHELMALLKEAFSEL